MNDTISRQAAINVADSSDYVGLSVEDVKKVTDEVVKGLKRLPSAQPEQQWIPIEERLPKPNQAVLVSIKGEVDADWIAVDSTGYGSWYRCMKNVTGVDAWMPLPKPYKGEES